MQDKFFAKSEELEKDLLNFLRGVIRIPSYSGDEEIIHDAETMAGKVYNALSGIRGLELHFQDVELPDDKMSQNLRGVLRRD